jgi:hypothetical protein
MMWSKHSRRTDPISRSAKPFCRGEAGAIGLSRMPMARSRRAQGYLKLPNGRALTGQSHDYKRHGTTTLFAALEVATGKLIATHSKRRRRVEFLDFMNSVTVAFFRTASFTSSSTTLTPTRRTSLGSRSIPMCNSIGQDDLADRDDAPG